ncbi:DNA helicase, partial [Bacillus cereus]
SNCFPASINNHLQHHYKPFSSSRKNSKKPITYL